MMFNRRPEWHSTTGDDYGGDDYGGDGISRSTSDSKLIPESENVCVLHLTRLNSMTMLWRSVNTFNIRMAYAKWHHLSFGIEWHQCRTNNIQSSGGSKRREKKKEKNDGKQRQWQHTHTFHHSRVVLCAPRRALAYHLFSVLRFSRLVRSLRLLRIRNSDTEPFIILNEEAFLNLDYHK